MSYLVLARKWRPKSFAEMVGQGHVLQALTNALNQSRLHHAYLFTGTRGVGKTTVARIFAKALNCEQGISSTPCGVCSACTAIDQGRFVDLIEVDAASRTGVDDTRELLENVAYAPVHGRFKIYLIDEVHMFSKSSFNALLKTLEEPPEHVKFLLATTDPQKLPVTVLSRCLQFNLRALPQTQIQRYLLEIVQREKLLAEDAAMDLIAEAAQGSMRDALSLLDQAIAYSGGQLDAVQVGQMLGLSDQKMILDVLVSLAENDATGLFELVDEALGRGVEPSTFLDQLLEKTHRLALSQWVPDAQMASYPPVLQTLDAQRLQLWYQIAGTGRRDLAWAPNARMGLEMTVLRMLAFSSDASNHPVAPPSRLVESPAIPPRRSVQLPSSPPVDLVQEPVPEPLRTPDARTYAPNSAPAESPEPVLLTSISDENWHEIVTHVAQPARALAERCHVRMQGEKIILTVAPGFAAMASPKGQESLLKQLAQRIDVSRVRIELATETAPSDARQSDPISLSLTPAERRSQHEEQDLAARIQSIDEHPAARALKERASAEIVTETIQPIASLTGSAE
ncbi:MAG: DNA polymerase III subunit gamma/tau [Halothiobacillus sp.]|jgi:DNA polymerase-3 subunit gamma/tau|nr:DNA polymerase III subunit gamma/tau [Halothiobacillus sp.]